MTPAGSPPWVGVALGANLGDPPRIFREAAAVFCQWGTEARFAPLYVTEPVDCPPGSPSFFNTVVVLKSNLPARRWLEGLQELERKAGRLPPGQRPVNAPRVLDLDLLFVGTERCQDADLCLPHPRWYQRAFVVLPLAEVAGDWVVPPESRTVAELARMWEGASPNPGVRLAASPYGWEVGRL